MTDNIDELPRIEMDRLGKYSLAYDPERNCTPVAWYRYGEHWAPWDRSGPVLAMFYALLDCRYALLESRDRVKELEGTLALWAVVEVEKEDRAKVLQLEKEDKR